MGKWEENIACLIPPKTELNSIGIKWNKELIPTENFLIFKKQQFILN